MQAFLCTYIFICKSMPFWKCVELKLISYYVEVLVRNDVNAFLIKYTKLVVFIACAKLIPTRVQSYFLSMSYFNLRDVNLFSYSKLQTKLLFVPFNLRLIITIIQITNLNILNHKYSLSPVTFDPLLLGRFGRDLRQFIFWSVRHDNINPSTLCMDLHISCQ